MKEFILLIVIGYILLLLDVTIFASIQFSYFRIEGIIPLVIWYGLKCKNFEPIIVVIILALIAGTFTYASTSVWILCLCIGYILAYYIYSQISNLAWYQHILLLWFITSVMVVILMFGTDATDLIWPYGITEAFILAIFCPLWFYFFDFLFEIFLLKEEK